MSLFSGEEDEDCAPLLLGPAAVLPLEEVELFDDRLAHLDVLRVELGTAVGVVDRPGVVPAEVGVTVGVVVPVVTVESTEWTLKQDFHFTQVN